MGFNNNGQIMVTCEGKIIKQWKFNNTLKLLRRLKSHSKKISCLVYSKKLNWFASGDCRGQIICWNEQQSYRAEKQHYLKITHLLLNNNEDELISCGEERKIKVCKINYPTIQYQYDFDTNHTDFTIGITMNISEKYILFYGRKLTNGNIKGKYLKEHIQKGIDFISDSLLVWQYTKSPSESIIFEMLEINNQENLIKRKDLLSYFSIKLNFLPFSDHFIYNYQKQIILQISCSYIFCLKQQKNDTFKIVSNILNCNDMVSGGAVRQDGQFIVLWFTFSQEYRIYKLVDS